MIGLPLDRLLDESICTLRLERLPDPQ